ncbi:MAG: terminase family protein, partial [Lysobacteraceae bacterium]
AVATTPEGFRFVYQQWGQDTGKAEANGYRVYRGHTEDNPNLDPAYIQTLRASYPPNLLRAYLEGEFVNLTSGGVYPDFKRKDAHAVTPIVPGEPLHIGMDFNVMNMTAVVFVVRDDAPYAVGEWTGVRDTPAMCELLRRKYAGHSLVIYPDASGASRKSVNAQESDHALLRQAGFTVRVNPSNPTVRDRINAVCAVLPRWKIDTDTCPRLVQALEQQVYDRNGEPDKAAGHDHPADAAGYFIAHRWPIRRRAVSVTPLRI